VLTGKLCITAALLD